MWARLQGNRRVQLHPKVMIHQDVLSRSAEYVWAEPHREVGGKFVGIEIWPGTPPPQSKYLETLGYYWNEWSKQHALCILGSIPPGPNAQQTATSLLPDGDFQYNMWRSIERIEPRVDHLGSWHSHHPNGLRSFSYGDRRHYASAVSDTRYNSNFFVAGLCFDSHGLARGKFDLYCRAAPDHPIPLSKGSIQVIDKVPSLEPIITEAYQDQERSVAGRSASAVELHAADTDIDEIQHILVSLAADMPKRFDEVDAVSWVFHPKTAVNMRVAVTYPRNRGSRIAVSMESSNDHAHLLADFSTVRGFKSACTSAVTFAELLGKAIVKGL